VIGGLREWAGERREEVKKTNNGPLTQGVDEAEKTYASAAIILAEAVQLQLQCCDLRLCYTAEPPILSFGD